MPTGNSGPDGVPREKWSTQSGTPYLGDPGVGPPTDLLLVCLGAVVLAGFLALMVFLIALIVHLAKVV